MTFVLLLTGAGKDCIGPAHDWPESRLSYLPRVPFSLEVAAIRKSPKEPLGRLGLSWSLLPKSLGFWAGRQGCRGDGCRLAGLIHQANYSEAV
jgi:hypothetical protein